MTENADALQAARQRAEVLEAIGQAQRRWETILPIITASEGPGQVIEELQRALGVSAPQANAIADIQFRRLSRADRQRIETEVLELQNEIERLSHQA